MIVEFSVKNFRSIKELQTISFVTTGLKSADKNKYVDEENVVDFSGFSLFKTIGIYGANASGKSNVIKAFDRFLHALASEPSDKSNLKELCSPFLYQMNAYNKESFFQVVLLIDSKKYRYGFTARMNSNMATAEDSNPSSDIITNEWLYGPKGKNTIALFIRKGQEIITNKLEGKDTIPTDIPYQHTFFLKHAAAFDSDGISVKILQKLRRNTTSNLELSLEKYRNLTIGHIDDPKSESKQELLKLLSVFNLNYDSIYLNNHNPDFNYPNGITPLNKVYMNRAYMEEGKEGVAILNMEYNESSGTQKLFDLCGLLMRIFKWQEPAILIVDEIDSHFHPSLLIKLISLFNDSEINRSNSQLLFTSHDTNLMSPSIMRRDQFYFTEKTENQATHLFSLAELKGIRNDADFAKQYLAGFYGALPILGNYQLEKVKNV